VLNFAVINFSDFKCEIPELNVENYKVWKEQILLYLGLMDINYAIRKNEPPSITETSLPDDVDRYEMWEWSNRLSVQFIMTNIPTSIRGCFDQHNNVRALLKAIDEHFVSSDKALVSTLIMEFSTIKLIHMKGVREHIMRMSDIAGQLKTLEVDMSESFLVHYILNTLPPPYEPLKISYNTHKEKWSINELLTMCVQEEERLALEMNGYTLMTIVGKDMISNQAKEKGKAKIPPERGIKKKSKCSFCNMNGHIKKDCSEFQKWFENKGKPISFVCYESNIFDVIYNT